MIRPRHFSTRPGVKSFKPEFAGTTMASAARRRLHAALLLMLLPAPALALWKQGWQLTGSLCQGNLPTTCDQLCTTWSQSAEGTCVAAAPSSISAGTWSTLTIDTENTATLRLFSDAACAAPVPMCNFSGATVDNSCVYHAMCDPSTNMAVQYSYKFNLIKTLPGYVIALIIFFGGVVPLALIVLMIYCCCCRGRAKTAEEVMAEPHEHAHGAHAHEHMEGAKRHSPPKPNKESPPHARQQRSGSPTREEERAHEFAERQHQKQQHQQQQQVSHALGAAAH